jgi:hypothetical protein
MGHLTDQWEAELDWVNSLRPLLLTEESYEKDQTSL